VVHATDGEDVYPLENVGELFNINYISVKLQMDSSRKDGEVYQEVMRCAEY